MSSIAIVGAGLSGLAAAHTLQDAGHSVTLFEKSNEVGGRAATGARDGFIYDSGAQYLKQGAPESVALITERFHTSDLLTIEKPVWIFDQAGKIQEGDPKQMAEQKWSYRFGLRSFLQRMAEGLNVHLQTPVTGLRRSAKRWELSGTEGGLGSFERLLITLPAPQAVALIQASELKSALYTKICDELNHASYNPIFSVMLGYRPRPRTRPYYALVNTDHAHAISWLAWEHEKAAERAPAGAGLLIAQMGPEYSRQHEAWSDAELVHDAAQQVSLLLDENLHTPFFSDVQRWHYALPKEKADGKKIMAQALPDGLAFCGDAFVGGRAHLALENGILAAQQLLSL